MASGPEIKALYFLLHLHIKKGPSEEEPLSTPN